MNGPDIFRLRVILDHRDGADALLDRIAAAGAARTGGHAGDQNEVGRLGRRADLATDQHHLILQRLAQHLQHPVAKLREFIQK